MLTRSEARLAATRARAWPKGHANDWILCVTNKEGAFKDDYDASRMLSTCPALVEHG